LARPDVFPDAQSSGQHRKPGGHVEPEPGRVFRATDRNICARSHNCTWNRHDWGQQCWGGYQKGGRFKGGRNIMSREFEELILVAAEGHGETTSRNTVLATW
jgi:hypothetical protein